MNYLPQLLEIHSSAQLRLDELNDELSDLIAEQMTMAETLNDLLGEIEAE